MKKSNKVIQFGEDVEGYDIPVLNEREIRASAGILFASVLIAVMLAFFKGNFMPIKYFVVIFLTDFIIRIFVNPKFAPTLIIGRMFVSRQAPEYVGAAQKKLAWKIGLALASLMFVLMVAVNSYSHITVVLCLICGIFLFFESAFGICLGCWFYGWYYKDKAQYCPGEICEVTLKQAIQKTSKVEILIIFGFIAYILALLFLLDDSFRERPGDLWNILSSMLS